MKRIPSFYAWSCPRMWQPYKVLTQSDQKSTANTTFSFTLKTPLRILHHFKVNKNCHESVKHNARYHRAKFQTSCLHSIREKANVKGFTKAGGMASLSYQTLIITYTSSHDWLRELIYHASQTLTWKEVRSRKQRKRGGVSGLTPCQEEKEKWQGVENRRDQSRHGKTGDTKQKAWRHFGMCIC